MKANDPAAEILLTAQSHCEDVELDSVREYKKANPKAMAIGYMPIYAPRPLLEAIGCLPVAIFGGGDQVDIIRGDSYYQSYICHIPRSTIELGLDKKYDCLDGMIFPSICDVIRNLGGMWKLLFPETYAAYLDLPQNFDAAIGGKFYLSELRRIARELQERGAKPLSDEALRAAIVEENERAAAAEALWTLRREESWKVPASEAYSVMRAGSAMWARDHAKLLRDFVAAASKRTGRPVDNVRVALRGSFCEQPPVALIRSLERAGCDIVDDDFQLGLRTIDGPIEVQDGEDPLQALVTAFLKKGRQTASRYIAEETKGEEIVSCVRDCKADGVVFAAASFCDPALLDQPMLEAALRKNDIPFTSFKFSENTGQFQVIREQAGAFSDAVRLWGGAE